MLISTLQYKPTQYQARYKKNPKLVQSDQTNLNIYIIIH